MYIAIMYLIVILPNMNRIKIREICNMIISNHMKKIKLVVIVFIVLFLAGIQSVNAAVNGTVSSFTVQSFPPFPSDVDDTPFDNTGFYGWVSEDTFIENEHFFEFDISGIGSPSTAFLDLDLYNNTNSDPLYGLAHNVSLAYYAGTGVTDMSLFGTGTALQNITLNNPGLNSYHIDVSTIFNSFKNSGNDYLGFRLYDPVWTSDPGVGDQLQYVGSTLTTAVAPEPVSTVLFLTGGIVLGSRSYLRRKRNNI